MILFHKTDIKINLEKLVESYYDIYTSLRQADNVEDSKIYLDVIISAEEIKMKLCEKIFLNSKFLSNNYSPKQTLISMNTNIIVNSFENVLKVG